MNSPATIFLMVVSSGRSLLLPPSRRAAPHGIDTYFQDLSVDARQAPFRGPGAPGRGRLLRAHRSGGRQDQVVQVGEAVPGDARVERGERAVPVGPVRQQAGVAQLPDV